MKVKKERKKKRKKGRRKERKEEEKKERKKKRKKGRRKGGSTRAIGTSTRGSGFCPLVPYLSFSLVCG